jgi:thioredoxin reductase
MGFGNTAADMSTELSKTAEQVYLSHRHGAIVVCDPVFYEAPYRGQTLTSSSIATTMGK